MKSIKEFLKKFSAAEFIVVTLALLLSLVFITVGFSAESNFVPEQSSENNGEDPVFLRKLYASHEVYDINGKNVNLFDTEFEIYYETNYSEDYDDVIEVLDQYLVPYHKLFDRHHYYFSALPVDETKPTTLEKETLPKIYNLNYINDHFDESIEIEKPLYELLTFAKEKTLFSAEHANGAFNMFVGELYDFWQPFVNGDVPLNLDPYYDATNAAELNELVAAIPHTKAEINKVIELWEENSKYYIKLTQLDETSDVYPSISLGGTGKGYMADVLRDELTKRGLTNGLVNGGESSITFLKAGEKYAANVNIAINSIDSRYSPKIITFKRNDLFALSTSGITEGARFRDDLGNEVIRSHIVNPVTGYPAQNSQHLVTVISNEISSLELDYLTTSLIVLSLTEVETFLNTNYAEIDYSIIIAGYDEEGKFIGRSNEFPGGNGNIINKNNEYREFFLDLL